MKIARAVSFRLELNYKILMSKLYKQCRLFEMNKSDENEVTSHGLKVEKLTGVISVFMLAHKINKMRKGERIIIDGGDLKVGDQNV